MALQGVSKTYYSIEDCRDLTRAEMLGFVSIDTCSLNLPMNFLRGLIKGPWTIQMDPIVKGIKYSFVDDNKLNWAVLFIPMDDDGMQIDYLSPYGSDSSYWTSDEALNFINS